MQTMILAIYLIVVSIFINLVIGLKYPNKDNIKCLLWGTISGILIANGIDSLLEILGLIN